MWSIHTMEYYSGIKNKDFMNFAGKWMELENIILSEVNQSPKDIYTAEFHKYTIGENIITEMESIFVVPGT